MKNKKRLGNSPFSTPFINQFFSPLGSGISGGGGAPAITYLLKTALTGVSTATLSNGTTYTSTESWIDTGSITVVDTAGGTVKTASNAIELVGSANWATTGFDIPAVSGADGLVYQVVIDFEQTGSTVNAVYGFTNTGVTGSSTQWEAVAIVGYSGAGYDYETQLLGNGTSQSIKVNPGSNLTINTQYTYSFVMDSTNGQVFCYIKGGAEYPSHTLMGILSGLTLTSVVPFAASYGGTHNIYSAKVTETLFPELVTPTDSEDFAGTADTLVSTLSTDILGASWSGVGSGGNKLNGSGGAIYNTSSSSSMLAGNVFPIGTYSFVAEYDFNQSTSGAVTAFIFNVADANNWSLVDFYSNTLRIVDVVSGSGYTTSVAYTFPGAGDYKIRVYKNGSSIRADLFDSSGTLLTTASRTSTRADVQQNIGFRNHTGPVALNLKYYPITGFTELDNV